MKIHFKKILVSILVIAGFVFYVIYQHFNTSQLNIADNQQDNSTTTNTSSETVANASVSQSTNTSTTTTLADNTNNSNSGLKSGDDGEYGDDEEEGNSSVAQTTQTTNSQTTTSNTGTGNNTSVSDTTTTSATTSTTSASGLYKDGQYDGIAADAYYGIVQVRAIIQSGKLIDVQFLSYPNNESHSREVNSIATPILKSEAIKAQSAQVNIVSGATNTSRAFIQSISSALNAAKV
ncbi:MAG: FMN-binding protein [Candidatus Humimicrobiaceae bacterium]